MKRLPTARGPGRGRKEHMSRSMAVNMLGLALATLFSYFPLSRPMFILHIYLHPQRVLFTPWFPQINT